MLVSRQSADSFPCPARRGAAQPAGTALTGGRRAAPRGSAAPPQPDGPGPGETRRPGQGEPGGVWARTAAALRLRQSSAPAVHPDRGPGPANERGGSVAAL